ncbi:MAG: acyltransferase [Prevotella sp.]|nr:acyltransferase [Prevotella sp.]
MITGVDTRFIFRNDFYEVTSEYRTAIMGLAMLSIMLFHQYFTTDIPFNAFHYFGYWGVDVFLFLSGMGLERSLENNPLPVYYKRRFKRIIPSCILCGTTKYLTFILLGSSVAVLKDGLNLGWWSLASLDLWFIPTILILYTISPLLYHLLCKWPYTTIATIIIVLFINGLTLSPIIGSNWFSPQGVLSRTIERLPVFTAGMLISTRKDWVNEAIPYSMIFLLIALGIKILVKAGIQLYGDSAYSFLALAFGMPALIVINIYVLKIMPCNLKRCVIFLGKYSLELYLVHEFIFWSLKIIFINVSPWILLPTGILLSCLAACLCKLIINKCLS